MKTSRWIALVLFLIGCLFLVAVAGVMLVVPVSSAAGAAIAPLGIGAAVSVFGALIVAAN